MQLPPVLGHDLEPGGSLWLRAVHTEGLRDECFSPEGGIWEALHDLQYMLLHPPL